MARVADYSIIADAWVVEATQDTIDFEVPSTIDAGSRFDSGVHARGTQPRRHDPNPSTEWHEGMDLELL